MTTGREKTLEDALNSMCWQFAYRVVNRGKRTLTTGGLSALERAFDALEWDDPYYPEGTKGCSAPDCEEWGTGGHPHETGYYFTCAEHWDYVPS